MVLTLTSMVSPVVDENGNEYDVMQQRCVEIDFPGKVQGMTRLLRRQTASGPVSWMGSLMQDAQDASGLMFRRNRYYDPASGRFTQEDPIGLAGGVNSYGFANGDPVGYSDPYGLSACCPPGSPQPVASPEDEPTAGDTPGVLMSALQPLGELAERGIAKGREFWAEHGDLVLIALSRGMARGGGGGTVGIRPLLGRNPIPSTGRNPRMNTDLPGGRAVGKSIFRNQTRGQQVQQTPLGNGGVRRTAPDRTQIRMNPDGSTRVDLPNRGPIGSETIHIGP